MNPSSGRPLLRRVFDYYRREGFRALVGRIGQEVMQRSPAVERNRHRLPPAIADALPPAIFGNLDLPGEDAMESSVVLRVAGWAWARDGIATIDVLIDDNLASSTTTSIHRPDVGEAFLDEPSAATSGFSTDVSLASLENGLHTVAVVAQTNTGMRRSFERRFTRVSSQALYHAYYEQSLPTPEEVARLEEATSTAGLLPEFLFVIDAQWDGDLVATVRSIEAQTYISVDWLILADASRYDWITDQLGPLPSGKLVRHPFEGRSKEPTPTFVGFLLPGERLAPGSVATFAWQAVQAGDLIYSDHDLVQRSGRHVAPSFKPDWSPDHLLHRNYVGPSYVVRDSPDLRRALRSILRTRGPGWRYDLLLRVTDEHGNAVHIPRVLWSLPDTQAAQQNPESELRAVRAALARRGHRAIVEQTGRCGVRRVSWQHSELPKVSIIIPTTGRIDYLRVCLDSLRSRTVYTNYEILIVDNGRGKHRDGIEYAKSLGLRILTRDEPFNWAKLNNDGARETDGELLLFLNDDVEIVDGNWLTELVNLGLRPEIGAVGPMLLYPDGSIQHAGVVLVDHGGGAMHLLHGMDPEKRPYQDLDAVCREVSANTGACLLTKRVHFDLVGGFDEDLPIVGNDVDFCLRLLGRGYRNLWTPHSRLVHHESVSRAALKINADEKKMWARWAHMLQNGDPYFNPNLDPTKPDASIRCRSHPVSGKDVLEQERRQGVNLVAYIRAEMGLGEAARGYAHALSEAAVPFTIVDYGAGNPARMGDDSWLHKIGDDAPYAINLLHVNADRIGDLVASLPPQMLENRYTIGYWAWEMPEFPDEWLDAFDLVDEVWVPSIFVEKAVAKKSPRPVIRVPHVVEAPEGPFVDRMALGVPATAYVFLTMYDGHSVRERKNPEGAVRAFKAAFSGSDRTVALVIKANGRGSDDSAAIGQWADGYENIHVIDRVLSRHETDSLIRQADCFVSLHRAEGFGLPIAEAMSHGRPVIATYWSGNTDFMDSKSAACIDYQLAVLERDYGPYKAGQHWAEPDIDQAAWWMAHLRDHPEIARQLGHHARREVRLRLSARTVGATVADRLQELPTAPSGTAYRRRSPASTPIPIRPTTPVHFGAASGQASSAPQRVSQPTAPTSPSTPASD